MKNADFLPADLVEVIAAAKPLGRNTFGIHVSRKDAERLRAMFTERLAKTGFNPNYVPTSEGRMLEDLIDKFFWTEDT